MRKKNTNEQLHTQPQFRLKPVYAAVLLAFTVQTVQANPMDATVVSGQASFATSGSTLTVTNTPGAIINWQGFSISANEITRFAQQSASSTVLNRVISNNASSILGTLQSNGRVFLINPNGIVFGAGSTVDVAGLVASTLNLSNADFLAGRYSFTEVPGAQNISNAGNIASQGDGLHGGQIYLIAPDVENTGVITAPNGEILLAAGHSVDLVNTNSPNLIVNITAPAGDATNVGQLIASSGSLGLFGTVVRNSGQVSADSATLQGGKIVFRASQRVEAGGTISTQGVGGGEIKVLADMQNGTVNVSGTLDASAPNSGNGGFIETSAAHVQVADTTRVSTLAPNGKAGTWLIDPTDYTIAAVDPANGSSYMSNTTLATNLAGSPITIQTLAGGAGNGDIFVNDAVSWSANTTLTLSAAGKLNVNSNITATGNAAGLVLVCNSACTGNKYSLNNGAVITLSGSNPSLTIGGNAYTVINSLGAAGSTTGTDLQGMSGNLAGRYALGINIDASATSGWSGGFLPVGIFTGTFDGLGHTITGLTINRPVTDNIGLFGYAGTNSVIKNVGLVGVSVSGRNQVGGLVGLLSAGTITNSYSTGSVSVSVSGSDYVGGLVGYDAGTITYSYNTGNVNGTGNYVGGLVGMGATAGSAIYYSYSTGTVNGVSSVGGLVGNTASAIENSYSTGTVSGSGSNVGGLVGGTTGTITNSYSTGNVSGSINVGGLVGFRSGGTITNSYWDTQTSGQSTNCVGTGSSAGCTGRITSDMMAQASFTGFDFTNTWYMIEGNTRPFLRSEYSTTINNAHQLQLMSMNLGASYTLGANIDMADTSSASSMWSSAGFVPVGNGSGSFTGKFDGLGHTISNLTINRPSTNFVGLFGYTNAGSNILNVGMVGGSISGLNFVGGLVGNGYGTVNNSYVISSVSGSGYSDVGGLVGHNFGTISNSYAAGIANGNIYIGGLVGVNSATISNSYATGSASGNGDVGGLVGYNQGTINIAYATGSVSSGSGSGGLVGYNDGTVSNSYATGSISGTSYVGGLVGMHNVGTVSNSYATGSVSGSSRVGGLEGWNVSGTVNNSYATGNVSGVTNVGGLMGYNGGTVSNSYWDIQTSGQLTSAAGTGLTSSEMMSLASFSGWSIANTGGSGAVWRIYEGNTYPLLRSFLTPLNVLPTYDGSGTALTDIGSYTLPSGTNGSLVLGSASNSLTLTSSGVADSYLASLGNGLYSPSQQGYDIYFSRTITTATSTAGDILLGNPITWTNGILNIDATGGNIHANADISGGAGSAFNLQGGTWRQVNSSLPIFNVHDFAITGGTFIRALGGDGLSVGTAYQLADIFGVQGMGSSGMMSKSYVLANDVDATATATWNPAGLGGYYGFAPVGSYNSNPFTGQFNGQNHAISNLTITRPTEPYVGLFSYVNYLGSVSNVALLDATVIGGNNVGALAGRNEGSISGSSVGVSSFTFNTVSGGSNVGGLVGYNYYGSIDSSQVSATHVSGGSGNYVGGLVGYDDWGTISSSTVDAGTVVSGGIYVGGLLGWDSGEGVITGNTVTDTTVNGNDYVGGLAGGISNGWYGVAGNSDDNHVVSSFVNGGVVSGGLYIGGLVGWNGNPLSNSDVSGTTVNGKSNVGGLVGYNDSASTSSGVCLSGVCISNSYVSSGSVSGSGISSSNIGGLVGQNAGTIINTYASGGTVSGNSSVGGLVGNNSGSISNSYASNGVLGSSFVGGLVGNNAYGGSVSTSFWNTTTAGGGVLFGIGYDTVAPGGTDSGAAGLNTIGMMTMANFTSAGWSIDDSGGVGMIWRIYQGNTTPLLTSFLTPLTVTANPATKTYDGNAFSGGNGVTYSIGGAVVSGTLTYIGSSQGAINAGSFAITPSGLNSDQQGYNIKFVNGTLTINPAIVSLSLGITANDASKTYGTTLTFAGTEFTTVGLQGGDTISGVTLTSAGAVATANAGAYAIVITPGSEVFSVGYASNYTITFVNGALTVTPATLTYTATAANRLYGATDPAFSGSVTGFVLSDTLATTTTGTTSFTTDALSTINAGSYAITGSGLTATNVNYVFTQAAGNSTAFTISPAILTYTANAASRTYGAADPAFGGSVGGFVLGESLATATTGSETYTTTATSASNAGSYAITGSGLTANFGNYTFAQAAGNSTAFTISPAILTYTANAASRTYGAADPAFSGSVGGFVLGENLATATTGTATFSTGALNTSNVGSYAITGSGLTANFGNYTFAQAAGNSTAFTINPATLSLLSVTANNASKTYGTTLTFNGSEFTPVGLLGGDTISGVTLASAGAVDTANAGTYAITPSNAVFSIGSASNYTLSYVDGQLTVTARPINVTADAISRVYGDADPALTYTVGGLGLTSWDTNATAFTGALARAAGENVAASPYAISQGTLTATNYTITFAGNIFTITPAPLSVYAYPTNKIISTPDPLLGYMVAGLKLGDTAAATLNAGSLARDAGEAVGNYQINQGSLALASSNYTMNYFPANFTILAPTVVDEIANAILLLGTPETGSAQSTSSSDEEEKRKAEEAVVVAETPESGDTTKPPLPVCPGS